ncbi:hypothetical protein BDV93DRAFT_504809 [Ceratobasidium sp. AG-I]|nr:hypothetical protein BDV93DRAFT_504809 [Ceratobasidium sp. AG-I]
MSRVFAASYPASNSTYYATVYLFRRRYLVSPSIPTSQCLPPLGRLARLWTEHSSFGLVRGAWMTITLIGGLAQLWTEWLRACARRLDDLLRGEGLGLGWGVHLGAEHMLRMRCTIVLGPSYLQPKFGCDIDIIFPNLINTLVPGDGMQNIVMMGSRGDVNERDFRQKSWYRVRIKFEIQE